MLSREPPAFRPGPPLSIATRLAGRGAVSSLKELLLAMPPGGEDADFERSSDPGRDAEL